MKNIIKGQKVRFRDSDNIPRIGLVKFIGCEKPGEGGAQFLIQCGREMFSIHISQVKRIRK